VSAHRQPSNGRARLRREVPGLALDQSIIATVLFDAGRGSTQRPHFRDRHWSHPYSWLDVHRVSRLGVQAAESATTDCLAICTTANLPLTE
jgi:hypothetical protein